MNQRSETKQNNFVRLVHVWKFISNFFDLFIFIYLFIFNLFIYSFSFYLFIYFYTLPKTLHLVRFKIYGRSRVAQSLFAIRVRDIDLIVIITAR